VLLKCISPELNFYSI